MSNEPNNLERALIEELERQAQELRDRVAEAELRGSQAALGFRAQLAAVEEQLARIRLPTRPNGRHADDT
jgi:hypothetical protein